MKEHLIVCPVCRGSLQNDLLKLVCLSCGSAYPLLTENIPIILPDPYVFVTNAFLQYETMLIERLADFQKIKTPIIGGYGRSDDTIGKLETAYRTNNEILREIADALKKHVSLGNIKDACLKEKPAQQSYLFNVPYLLRDWVGIANGEIEIQTISENIIQTLEQHSVNHKDDSVLFLGAGMGRIACEVSGHFGNQGYAVDNSTTMAYLFDKISRKETTFYEVNLKNTEKSEDITVEHLASTKVLKRVKDGETDIQYLVGDASKLPFPDNSLSAVVSVYFTDVIPLPILVKEVKRVLKSNGIFIHFGPLEYHHDDIRFMFSLEETKQMFSRQQFNVNDHQTLSIPHCRVSSAGMYKTYQVWLFVAEKMAPVGTISDSTRISMNRDIDFFQNGTLGPGKFTLHTSLALGVNDVYEGAETVLDILKLIKEGQTFEEMIKELQIEYGDIANPEQEKIKQILLDLAGRGVLLLEQTV